MEKSRTYPYWHDAKTQANQASFLHGHAWIVSEQVTRTTNGVPQTDTEFKVLASDSVDDAPASFIVEFMEGVEQ